MPTHTGTYTLPSTYGALEGIPLGNVILFPVYIPNVIFLVLLDLLISYSGGSIVYVYGI